MTPSEQETWGMFSGTAETQGDRWANLEEHRGNPTVLLSIRTHAAQGWHMAAEGNASSENTSLYMVYIGAVIIPAAYYLHSTLGP